MSRSKKSIFHLNGRDSAEAILKQGLYHAFNPGQGSRGGSFEQDIKNIFGRDSRGGNHFTET